jgi:uncharacterized protein
MAFLVQRRTPTGFVDVTRRPVAARRRVAAATATAGVALAILAGHDGTLGWRIARLAAVAMLTIALLALQPRLGDRGCGRAAVVGGVVVLAVGVGFMPYVVKDGRSVEAVAGMVAVVAGVVLAVGGTVLAARGRRAIRRIAAGAGTVILAVVVTFVVGPAVAATNVPRAEVGATPVSKGLFYESVTVTSDDGVRLAGWYLASTNHAAVVLLHGAGSTRSGVLDEAAVLAAHGFGVLMIDARGHGDSGGRAMDFGWHGDADIAAATGFLADRPEVDSHRIGVVGMSMGGEEAVGASATNQLIRAVVAEGATARSAGDAAWLPDEFGFRGLVQEQLERLQDVVTDALTNASVPTSMREAVETSGDTRYLLITAGNVADEGRAAAYFAAGSPSRVDIWTVPEAGHTDGLQTQPEEWEARVIAFLTDSLGPTSGEL